jgi:hypothetical protein
MTLKVSRVIDVELGKQRLQNTEHVTSVLNYALVDNVIHTTLCHSVLTIGKKAIVVGFFAVI